MRSESGDDDGRVYCAFSCWPEGRAPKVPRIAVPDYDPKVKRLSLRTPVPSPAAGASPSGPPSDAVLPEISASVPPTPMVEGSPMHVDENTPALVPAPVAGITPFPLRSVPAPVAVPSSPVLPTDVPAFPAPSVNAPGVVIWIPAPSAPSVPIAVASPVPVPSLVAALQATPLPVIPTPTAEMEYLVLHLSVPPVVVLLSPLRS